MLVISRGAQRRQVFHIAQVHRKKRDAAIGRSIAPNIVKMAARFGHRSNGATIE